MQGLTVDDYFMYQYNLIVVLLEKNGKQLISYSTKYIQVRYFFIKDCIAVGDVNLEHFPMGILLRDHFMKSLQGSLSNKLRAEILGIPDDSGGSVIC